MIRSPINAVPINSIPAHPTNHHHQSAARFHQKHRLRGRKNPGWVPLNSLRPASHPNQQAGNVLLGWRISRSPAQWPSVTQDIKNKALESRTIIIRTEYDPRFKNINLPGADNPEPSQIRDRLYHWFLGNWQSVNDCYQTYRYELLAFLKQQLDAKCPGQDFPLLTNKFLTDTYNSQNRMHLNWVWIFPFSFDLLSFKMWRCGLCGAKKVSETKSCKSGSKNSFWSLNFSLWDRKSLFRDRKSSFRASNSSLWYGNSLLFTSNSSL